MALTHRGLWVVFVLLLVAGFLVVASGNRVYAACAATTDAASLERADLVALGTVEEVEVNPLSSRVEVRVERVFKGQSDEVLYVTTDSGSTRALSTDVRFEEGVRYLLYLSEEDGKLETSICAGTRPLTGASPELPSGLGEGLPPSGGQTTDDDTGTTTLPQTGGLPLFALAVLIPLCAGAVLWRRRQYR